MIILHLKDIIKSLLRFLDQTKPELVPAVLSLIGILSRDLRSEFYPYFDIVLQCFTAKIEEWRTMPDQLEALFTTMARSFKYLEKYLVKDIKQVFLLYKEFFLTRKEHVRQFAAESFAYLLRKLPFSKLDEMMDFILSQIPLPSEYDDEETERRELADGIGFLFFYVVQGIKGKLTTSSSEIVPLICSKLTIRTNSNDSSMDVDEEEDGDDKESGEGAMPTLKLKTKAKETKNVEESLDNRFVVMQRFTKSIRAHFHNDDCPLFWESLSKVISGIIGDSKTKTSLARDEFRTLGYTYSLVAEYIHNRHLPNMATQSQRPFLDRALSLLTMCSKAICSSPSPPVPQGPSHTRETLERLAIDFGVPLFELISNEHSSAANSVRKEARDSLDRLFALLDLHPAIAYRFTLGLKHTSLFKHYLFPLTLQFVDRQLKRIETHSDDKSTASTTSKNSPSTPHPTVKDTLWFVYTLASEIDWGTMMGAANVNVATKAFVLPSDRLATHCLSLLSNLKPSHFEDPSHLATMWMAVYTTSYLQINSSELVTNLDAALCSFLDHLDQKSPKFKKLNLPESTREMLVGQTLTTRCKVARSSGTRHADISLDLLKSVLSDTIKLLKESASQQPSRHVIQAFADMVQLALLQPYGDPMRYQDAKVMLRDERDFLTTLLEEIGTLTSHFNVMVRRSSWTLLRSLAELDDQLPIYPDLAILCERLANQHIDPLQHRDLSSQFSDIVELALKPSAKPFDRSLAVRFLVGILFVQLTPLWPPALKALQRLHDLDSKTFWSVCVPLMTSAQAEIGRSKDHSSVYTSQESESDDESEDMDDTKKEHSNSMDVDDPSAQNTSQHLYLDRAEPASIESLFQDLCIDSFRFTGASSFSDSLWTTLSYGAKTLAPASHTAATLFDNFLRFISDHFPYIDDPARMHIFSQSSAASDKASDDFKKASKSSKKKSSDDKKGKSKNRKEDDEGEEEDFSEMPGLAPAPHAMASGEAKLSKAAVGEIRRYLLNSLKFFGTFKNVNGVKKVELLFPIFEKLVGLANPEIQLASLQCMSIFEQGQFIIPYKSNLEMLIQDERGRTPFTAFPLQPTKSVILLEHRPLVIPIITRILYPKLSYSKQDVGRRGAVLSYIAQCDSSELSTLFELTLGSSTRCISELSLPTGDEMANRTNTSKSSTPKRSKGKSSHSSDVVVSHISLPDALSPGQLFGSCRMIADMIKSMGAALHDFLPTLFAVNMWYLHLAQTQVTVVAQEEEGTKSVRFAQHNQLRKAAIRNISSMIAFFDSHSYACFEQEMMRLMHFEAKLLSPIEIIPDNQPFIEWCVTISSRPRQIYLLKDFLLYIVDLLKRSYMSLEVRSRLFTILENLFKVRDVDEHAGDFERNQTRLKALAEAEAAESKKKGSKKAAQQSIYDPGEIIAGLTAKQRAKMDPAELHIHMSQYALSLEYQAQSDIVLPHSNDLLDAMQLRLFADHSAKRRVGKRELEILEKLSRYATTSEHADKLASLILPFAKQKGFHPETRLRILSLFNSLIPLMTNALSHIDAIRQFFVDMKDLKCRAELGRIFTQLSKLDPVLSQIGDCIHGLNAMSKVVIDEPDYERRMQAYTELNEKLIKKLPSRAIAFVIANYLFFISHEDLSIRNNAGFGLTLIVRRVAGQFDEKGNPKSENDPNALPLALVTDTIYNQIKRQLNSPSELTRREYLSLLSNVVETMPNHFSDLVPALGTGDDSNFFLCIHHLQSYRRSRILAKLAELIRADKLPKSGLLQVFFPVIKQLILGATHKQHAIVDEAIKTTAAIAEKLDWRSYWSIVQSTLKGMEANKEIQNQWIKLLCSVLDTFHFDISKVFEDIVQESKPKRKSFNVMSEHANFDEEEFEAQMAAQIQEEHAKQLAAEDDSDEEEDDENKNAGENADVAAEEVETDSDPEYEEDRASNAQNEDNEVEAGSADAKKDEKANQDTKNEIWKDLPPEDLLQRQIQRTVVKKLLPTLLRLMKSGDSNDNDKFAKGGDRGSGHQKGHKDRAPAGAREKEEKSVLRTNVIVCAVRLLHQLPDAMSHTHISMFVIEVSNQLASRAFANRIAASISIQEILKVLGPAKFLFILDILVAQLRRGFQLHILCHTVHTLLKALQPIVEPGQIDEGLHMLNKIFFEELLGKVAEQKTVSKITSATAEASKTYAYDSIGIVAQLINFESSIRILIDPIFDVILASTDVKVIKKMRKALDQISVGIRSNSSVTPEKLCIFVYRLVDQYSSQNKVIEEETEKTDMEKTWIVEDNPYKQGTYAAAAQITGKEVDNDHIVVAYALSVLFSLVKSSRLSPKVDAHLSLLDPFVAVLARNLRSKKDDVLVISLRCLTALLKYPLPSIEGRSSMLAEATIHLLQKANLQSDLLKMCFKTLSRVIISSGHSKKALKNIPNSLWTIVIGYIREIFESDTPQHALELFRAMVGRRIVLAEMYDAMKKVNQLLVQTRLTGVRGICEQIVTTFILTYPLEQRRLEQQLEFIMANLTFPESNGRLAIMQLLKSMFQRFPEELLNKHMQYFFLPLVAQMVNDDFAENRAAASSAIDSLYARVSTDHSGQLLQTALKWYEDDTSKTSLQRAAAQLITVFATRLGGDSFSTFAKRLIPTFLKRLEQVTADYEEEEDLENFVNVSDEQWQAVYFTLLAIEKTVALCPQLALKSLFSALWRRIASPQLLSFPHAWVRLLCARLLGTYFNARKESMPIRPQKADSKKKGNGSTPDAQSDWLSEPRRMFSMAQLFCEMFSAPDLSEELGTQVVKNLYWITLQLQEFPELTPLQQIQAAFIQGDDQIESADEKEDDEDEEEEDVRKTKRPETDAEGDIDEAKSGEDSGMDVDGQEDKGESSEDEEDEVQKVKKSKGSKSKKDESSAEAEVDDDRTKERGVPAVSWILRRTSYMTKTLSRLGKSCVFKYFAAITMTMKTEEVKDYLVFMLFPLFRANETILARETARRKSDRPIAESAESIEFTELVHQVAELLRKKVGTTAYYEGHERVRARILQVRQKRKSELAIEAVVNPAKHALRKAARQEKSKQSKKRKIEAHMAHRTTNRLKMRKLRD